MTTAFTERLKEKFAGEFSEAEKRLCARIVESIEATLDGHWSFEIEMVFLWADLEGLRRFGFDADAVEAAGGLPLNPKPKAQAEHASLNPLERAFLEDAKGLIDWATRNGVSFSVVLQVLGHDIGEIARHDFSLEKTITEGFVDPKVSGWAKRNSELIGESVDEG
jgi:hypothetical protein